MKRKSEEKFKRLEKAISLLRDDVGVIGDIIDMAHDKFDSNIYVTFPNKSTKKEELTFIVDNPKAQIDIFSLAEAMVVLVEILDYDKVVVIDRQNSEEATFNRLFRDTVLISKDNIDEIRSFFKEHFSEYLKSSLNVKQEHSYEKFGFMGKSSKISKNRENTVEEIGERAFQDNSQYFKGVDQQVMDVDEKLVVEFLVGIIKSAAKCGCDPNDIIQAVQKENITLVNK